MSCEDFSELYELYALGVLDGPEKEALEEHIGRNCEVCMKEVKRAVESNAYVFRAVPKVEPPLKLRSRILAGFGLETRPLWWRAFPWAVAATAAALLCGTLFIQPRGKQIDGVARAIDFLSTPGTRQVSFGGPGPRGSVLMQESKGLLLVVVNLPAAPAGQMYESWIVPRSGDPRPAGQIQISKTGESFGLIPGPIDASAIKAVAVSLEPAASNPIKPTKVIFAAPVGP